MPFRTLTAALATKRVCVYSVDIEIELDLTSTRRRLQIVPQNVEAHSEEEARTLALAKERRETREVPKKGEPRIVGVRKLDFRQGW